MDIDCFVLNYLNRAESLFAKDLQNNHKQLLENISGKSIIVIGGAGTIGSSFIKATLKYNPGKLVVIDINENGLTELVRDLRSMACQHTPDEFYTYPLSFDSSVFKKVFLKHGPFDIVANFAAHKHVRSEKDIFSIEALLENNLNKAKDLLDLLVQYPPKHFFCVSTDKAANPVNVMGASKKMMEELILAYSDKFKVATARFANVAFSNGSLLDGFLRRIEKQQPLACPTDITRFFVSPKESGEICLMACVLSKTAEIFFPQLDMVNDLMNFSDFVTPLLAEFGYVPFICGSDKEARESVFLIKEGKYPVYFFETDTSGEKLFEEFFTDQEVFSLDRYQALGVISKRPAYNSDDFQTIIGGLRTLLNKPDNTKADIIVWLQKYIPEFNHIETGLGLDKKM